jgi:proteasome assembly chaperone (PAC2) family protein
MDSNPLHIHYRPELINARMILGFSGWMDGGEVSTGTVEYLVEHLRAEDLAEIDPGPFYIYNFPGSMSVSTLFRPHTTIEEGLVTSFDEPENQFYCHEPQRLILFTGKEPNIRWREFAECVFRVVQDFNVRELYFVGSVSGLVPHTRDPIFWSSSSDENTRGRMQNHTLYPSSYEGPASFATYMISQAQERGLSMATLVAAIPAYIEGKNARCILAAAVNLDSLRTERDRFMKQAEKAMTKDESLAEKVRQLEEIYDRELASDDDDIRDWFNRQNLQMD